MIMLMYIAAIGRLLHYHKIDKMFIYLTLFLVLVPYQYGMLDYFNMLFYGGACYAIKTIVPILLLLISSLLKNQVYTTKKGKIELIFFGILYLYFLGDGKYIAYSEDISALDFGETLTFELKVNGTTVQTLTYSVNSYAYSKHDDGDAMGNLALALYRYGVSAAAYNENK